MERTRAILVDITKCIGCRSCEQACKRSLHGFPKEHGTEVVDDGAHRHRRARRQVSCGGCACTARIRHARRRAWWAR